ncbi:MAG: DegT/DnrJ/EryC1/StrS family aminotransferase [Lachnospiraceae bacterium]|nr:DegT/DnrJ/EryC1/StrS family aminotransferase [Lachnospiraceae bacterium]
MAEQKILVTRSSMPPYEEYIEAIKPLWDTHWLTNMGEYHRQLESELKGYLGVPELSLMVNGHMALELAIQSFGFPEGAEVITTPFTFISTTHAIVRNRLKPVFCDVKEEDGTIDETKIEDLITEHTVAILPVHVYGNICNVQTIEEIAQKYGLRVIYDAAHAFGVTYQGRGIGCYGDVSVFSFHATKVFNTIEGGAVSFDDHRIYEKLYNLKNFGIRGEELVCEVGANAKMNEFCAIMGLQNLKRIDKAMQERKKRYDHYVEQLRDVEGIRFLKQEGLATSNYGYFPIVIGSEYKLSRNGIYDRLRENSIFARKYFCPLTSDQACFKNKYRDADIQVARRLADTVLVLPLYEDLKMEAVEKICAICRL